MYLTERRMNGDLEQRGLERLRDEVFAIIKNRAPCKSGSQMFSACEGGTCFCAQVADEIAHMAFDDDN